MVSDDHDLDGMLTYSKQDVVGEMLQIGPAKSGGIEVTRCGSFPNSRDRVLEFLPEPVGQSGRDVQVVGEDLCHIPLDEAMVSEPH